MIEIFPNIPQEVRNSAAMMFDLASMQHNPLKMVQMLNEYTNTCENEEEIEFLRFYFNLRMEQMKNESDNDKR